MFLIRWVGGLFGAVLRGGLYAVGALLACACVSVGALALIGGAFEQGQQTSQQSALARNGGRGSVSNPVPAGGAADFGDFTLRPARYVRDAASAQQVFSEWDPPAAGSVYSLLWVDMACRQREGKCEGHNVRVTGVDAQGRTWQRPSVWLVYVTDDFGLKDAVGGATTGGWAALEAPADAPLRLVAFTHNGQTLHVQAPPAS